MSCLPGGCQAPCVLLRELIGRFRQFRRFGLFGRFGPGSARLRRGKQRANHGTGRGSGKRLSSPFHRNTGGPTAYEKMRIAFLRGAGDSPLPGVWGGEPHALIPAAFPNANGRARGGARAAGGYGRTVPQAVKRGQRRERMRGNSPSEAQVNERKISAKPNAVNEAARRLRAVFAKQKPCKAARSSRMYN